MLKIFKNLLVFLIMIAIGVAILMFMKRNKAPLEHDDAGMAAKPVEVIEVSKQAFSASVQAYGNVEPAIVLQGKSQLSGKVTYVHPELRPGGSIPAGTVVVRIDPEDYQVNLKQTKADLASSKSQRDQVKQEEASTRRALKLAKDRLRLGEQELARIQSVWEKRLIAKSTLDAEEQKVIQLRQSVSDLEGQLSTYSSRLQSAEAQIDRSQQQVKGQKNTLGRTEIEIPFDARISSAEVEKGEFVSVASTLFEAINTDGVEIQAELPIKQMQVLVSSLSGKSLDIRAENSRSALEALQIKARVRLVGGKEKAAWDARVARFAESVDPTRRTIAVTVAVDKPYDNVIIGERPPLLKGMYVEVELYTPEYDAIVIPRKAIHSDRAFVVDQDNKLDIRPLALRFKQGNVAVVREGLKEGDRLIVNDLIPVIEGMPLAPQLAKQRVSPEEDRKEPSPQKDKGKKLDLKTVEHTELDEKQAKGAK